MRIRTSWLLAAVIVVIAAFPATVGAQDEGDGDGGGSAPGGKPVSAAPTAADVATELEHLVGLSVKAATPTGQFVASPHSQPVSGGTEELNTNIGAGELKSEIVINVGELRSVAQVEGMVCPDAQGVVSLKISMSIGSANGPPRVIGGQASGVADDDATLTKPHVQVTTGKGSDAALLKRLGDVLLKQAQKGWRGGMCVKIEVQAGGSQVVKPQAKVHISAIAMPRSGGGPIKGRMKAEKTAGQKKVEPGMVSDSPAKFTYTAPDKTPESGEVTLTSVSRRGIGIATLEYVTATGYTVDKGSSVGAKLTGTKCDGLDGKWSFKGVISQGLSSTSEYTITIGTGGLTGTYTVINTSKVATASVVIDASGAASIAPQKDGSILMKLAGSDATSTATGAGGKQTFIVPFPAESFTWKVDPDSCPAK